MRHSASEAYLRDIYRTTHTDCSRASCVALDERTRVQRSAVHCSAVQRYKTKRTFSKRACVFSPVHSNF